jgi:hypothetical protein
MAKTQKNKATSFHLGMCNVVDNRCERGADQLFIGQLKGSSCLNVSTRAVLTVNNCSQTGKVEAGVAHTTNEWWGWWR